MTASSWPCQILATRGKVWWSIATKLASSFRERTIINPGPLDAAEEAIAKGDLLRACDILGSIGATAEPAQRRHYLQALAYARMGETARAQTYYTHHFPNPEGLDVDTLALAARLKKDRAWQAESAQQAVLLDQASAAYEQIFRRTGDSFPAINAATLAFLAGHRDRAVALAQETLRVLDDDPRRDFFNAATAAEAHLLLGNPDESLSLIVQALSLPGSSLGARSSTTRQFSRLAQELGTGQDILDRLRPPPVLAYCGHLFAANDHVENELRAAVDEQLDILGSTIAFGALGCGADIVIAEAIFERGGELHVILPFAKEDFIDISVAVGGGDWIARFERCLAEANEVEFASQTSAMQQDRQFAFASLLTMGYAHLRANHLNTDAVQLAVWDGVERPGLAGTSADVARWRDVGGVTHTIPFDRSAAPPPQKAPMPAMDGRRQEVRAIMFSDFANFSRIDEGDLPRFWEMVLGRAAEVMANYDSDICSRNTWGDALYVVTTTATAAARLTLDLQAALAADGLEAFGDGAGMRIGLHLGSIFEAADPVTGLTTFFGRAVNMTARIEPVASVGEVYVTREFGAILEMEAPGEFELAYVGRIQLAKDFAQAAMYRLSRSTQDDA